MALDTFDGLWNQVKLRCPAASAFLCQDWINEALRVIAEKRTWSWLTKRGHIPLYDSYSTGTATFTRASATVAGAATVWGVEYVGRQITRGPGYPIHTITARASNISITIDPVWEGATATTVSYEIFQAYHTVPTDFLSFISVWDPLKNWQLHLNVTQEQINSMDAQRANSSQPYVIAWRDYDTTSPPLARYEVWPHQKSDYVLPYLYTRRITDLESSGDLPRSIRGDILLSYALAEAAAWPGPNKQNPNPFMGEWRNKYYLNKFERQVAELEKQDDEIFARDVGYSSQQMPYAPLFDADWNFNHGGEIWL